MTRIAPAQRHLQTEPMECLTLMYLHSIRPGCIYAGDKASHRYQLPARHSPDCKAISVIFCHTFTLLSITSSDCTIQSTSRPRKPTERRSPSEDHRPEFHRPATWDMGGSIIVQSWHLRNVACLPLASAISCRLPGDISSRLLKKKSGFCGTRKT
jgi:hypothetical protein